MAPDETAHASGPTGEDVTPEDPGRPFHPRDEPDALRPTGSGESTPLVIVGIDGSEQSRAALHWALRYARFIQARVEPVAVWHQPIQFGEGPPMPTDAFEAQARDWLADALADQPSERTGSVAHASVEQGDPAHVLLDRARRADLLVLGNHGRGALGAMVLGSVAQRCAHHARCPVVLVPGPG